VGLIVRFFVCGTKNKGNAKGVGAGKGTCRKKCKLGKKSFSAIWGTGRDKKGREGKTRAFSRLTGLGRQTK